MAKKEENKSSLGCLGTAFLVIIFVVIFGGCSACMHGGSDSDSKPQTHKVAKKKKPTKAQLKKKKQQEQDVKNSQKDMAEALSNDTLLSKYAYKINYQGESTAEIRVTDDFVALPASEKNQIAKKFNNLVTSNTEDDTEASVDPYSFLTFVTRTEKLVGQSKQFDHNVYKWKE